jgi:hypothetical protein
MDDQQLWQRFTSCSLSQAEWTHEAHVRVAFLFATRFQLDEAHLRLRAGIIRLNERLGMDESPERGYFETLTRGWLILVAAAARRVEARSSHALLEACPELRDRRLIRNYYSRDLIKSVRARSIFLDPDLAPLPDLP